MGRAETRRNDPRVEAAGSAVRTQSDELRATFQPYERKLGVFTRRGRKAFMLDRTATKLEKEAERTLNGFRKAEKSDAANQFAAMLVNNATDLGDNDLVGKFQRLLELSPEERYDAYKARLANPCPEDPDDYLLTLLDAATLVMMSDRPITLTVPLSAQQRNDGSYQASEAITNVLQSYEVLGIEATINTLITPLHLLSDVHNLPKFGIRVNFCFEYDREKVLAEDSEDIPYAKMSISKSPIPLKVMEIVAQERTMQGF